MDNNTYLNKIQQVFNYYKQNFSEIDKKTWLSISRRIGEDKVIEALSKHMRDPERGRWLPKISDIAYVIEGTAKDLGMIAWYRLIETVQRIGTYDSVIFDDPLIHVVVSNLGGYIKIGQLSNDEAKFKMHEFVNMYKHYYSTISSNNLDYPKKLKGIFEQQNPEIEHKAVLVGNYDKCLIVYKNGKENTGQNFSLASMSDLLSINTKNLIDNKDVDVEILI